MSKRLGDKLPRVTSQLPVDVRRYLDRVRDIFNGAGGEVLTVEGLRGLGVIDNTNNLIIPDDSGNLGIPPAVTNLAADGAFQNIIIDWDVPEYFGHAYTEIWASDIFEDSLSQAAKDAYNNLDLANPIAITSGAVYTDYTGGGKGRYYWARNVNIADTAGPFNAVGGEYGATAPDVELLLTTLTNSITESQLYSDLGERIDLVETLETYTGYVDTYTGISLVGRIDGSEQDITSLQSDLSTAESNITATSSAVSALDTRVTSAEGTITSQSSDITVLQSGLSNAESDITATSSAVSALDTRVTSAEGTITSQSSDITSLQSDLSNAESDITATSSAVSALDTRVTSAEGTITSQSSDITVLQSGLTTAESNITATSTAVSALDTRVTSAEGTITSQGTLITGLQSDLTDAESDISGNATNITSLDTRVTSTEGSITSISSTVSTLSTTVGDNTTAVQTNSSSINGLEGQYSVKIDNNGYVTGFGLSSTPVDGVPFSEMIIRADRFSIGSGNTDIIPFIVTTSTTTLNGVSVPAGVYIDQAYIKNGAISNAKIGSAAIDSAKIADAAITNAKIANAAIDSAKINDAAITNAKIVNAAITSAKIGDAEITNAKIANAAITTAKIGDAEITGAKIENAAITNAKIENGAITEAKIGNAEISTAKIKDAAINNAKIGTAAVDTLELAGQAVTIPNASFVTGTVNSGTALVELAAVTFTSSGAPVALSFSTMVTSNNIGFGGEATATIEVYRGTTLLHSYPAVVYMPYGQSTTASLSILDEGNTAGAVTYYVKAKSSASNGHTWQLRNLTTLEVKR